MQYFAVLGHGGQARTSVAPTDPIIPENKNMAMSALRMFTSHESHY
jgi:hypothetical protein